LEEELEATLNFLRRTTTSTTKPTLQVIIISDSNEEVGNGPQLVIEEQLQSVFASRHVEEEEL
jgi:hypothetical protein